MAADTKSRAFTEVLRLAADGDKEAMAALIAMFMPLFNSRSVINGKFSEDLRQYILIRVIEETRKFNPDDRD